MTTKTLGRAAIVGLIALSAPFAFAQTASTTGTGAGSTTPPGAPNTGTGGDAAANLALLTVSAATALGAAVYLSRKGALAR